jgi:hypothetical protein
MSASSSQCRRGTFVPKSVGDNGTSSCCPPRGGTKTAGAPRYILTIRNPDSDSPAECFFVLEDEEVEGNLVPITEDNGELICIDDI